MRTQMLVHDVAVELRAPAEADARLLRKLRKHRGDGPSRGTEWIVCADGEAVGYVGATATMSELRVHELALLRSHEGRGIRTAIVAELIGDAARLGVPLRTTLPARSRALQEIYRAHGMDVRRVDDDEIHLETTPIVSSEPRRPLLHRLRRIRRR